MRILILTIYHDPEPIPKTGELARELRRRGHDVHVVTAFPHYPDGDVYPGFKLALWHREVRDGVPVLRTYIYPYHGTSSIRRMVNYISWMLSSMLAALLTPKCDVIYAWHPPLTVGVTARFLRWWKHAPVILDVQDLWPESALASGMMRDGRLVRVMYRLADWVYARADRILVVSPQARAYLGTRGVPMAKTAVAKHWIDESMSRQPRARDVRAELSLGPGMVVMFAGNLGMVQGLETLVEAADLLRDAPVTFVIVGDGSDRARLEADAAARKLSNVIFPGRFPASDMPEFLAAADLLIVHTRASSVAEHAVPTKILAYLAAGRPILCGMTGAAASVMEASAAGWVTPPGDAAAMAGAIREALDAGPVRRAEIGRAARRYFDAEFDKQQILGEYERELIGTAEAGRARG